jgi:hypothetical protein
VRQVGLTRDPVWTDDPDEDYGLYEALLLEGDPGLVNADAYTSAQVEVPAMR